jgi:diadenosine tetraphosphatase ApaH/serine/threonine PP2A family protein phosphatase
MPFLIISDIHANLTALEAVLSDAGPYEAVWCLGDLVGYGPDPNECIQQVQQLPNLVCLLGNHDAAVLGLLGIESFNLEARQAVLWTRQAVNPLNLEFLANRLERTTIGQVTLVHGSPREPVWEYLLDTQTATTNFAYFDTPFCFAGHSHLPVIYQLANGQQEADYFFPPVHQKMFMTPRAILNPGSVGQPRDHDPRASYALFDPQALTWELRRVAYDIAGVQQRMLQAGLPARHIQRLAGGW